MTGDRPDKARITFDIESLTLGECLAAEEAIGQGHRRTHVRIDHRAAWRWRCSSIACGSPGSRRAGPSYAAYAYSIPRLDSRLSSADSPSATSRRAEACATCPYFVDFVNTRKIPDGRRY